MHMFKSITIRQKFNQPVSDVFELMSKHATYNDAFWPVQVERIKDAADPSRPDGLGSVRQMGFGKIKPIREEITFLEENKLIEYQIVKNPLVKHHLGRIQFESLSNNQTLVIYTIEFEGKLPLVGPFVLAQLKVAVTVGLKKLAAKA